MDFEAVLARGIHFVQKGLKHEDYQRTVELAEDYRKMITSVGLEEDLKKTSPATETPEMFKTRMDITHFTTKSVSNNIIRVFFRISKSDNLSKLIRYNNDKDDKKSIELREALKVYAGSKSLQNMLVTDYVHLVFEDPNSFVVTFFDRFNNVTEKAKPFPVVYYADEVYDFLFKNNILEYLFTFRRKTVVVDGKEVWIDTYLLFHKDMNVSFVERTDRNNRLLDFFTKNDISTDDSGRITSFRANNKTFDVNYFEHNTGFVSAFRTGYEIDILTRGKTMVGPLDPAMPYFMKSIKVNSELDISVTKNAHSQKYHFVGKDFKSVTDLVTDINSPDVDSPNSALEKTTIELQKGVTNTDIVDLSKMVHYHYIPTEFIKWLEGYVAGVNISIKRAVFNADTFIIDSTVKTATEKNIEENAINDTLWPMADKISESFRHTARAVGSMLDLPDDDLSVTHTYSGDFKTISVDDLIASYKLLDESGAPAPIKEAVSQQILEIQYKDDPDSLNLIKVKNMHFPFKNFSQEQIMFAIASGNVPETTKILYSNYDQIFDELVSENADFFELDVAARKVLIDAKVAAILEEILSKRVTAIPMPLLEEEDGS